MVAANVRSLHSTSLRFASWFSLHLHGKFKFILIFKSLFVWSNRHEALSHYICAYVRVRVTISGAPGPLRFHSSLAHGPHGAHLFRAENTVPDSLVEQLFFRFRQIVGMCMSVCAFHLMLSRWKHLYVCTATHLLRLLQFAVNSSQQRLWYKFPFPCTKSCRHRFNSVIAVRTR